MRTEKISDKNFGMKITDNMVFQTVQYFLINNGNSTQEMKAAFARIKNSADDSFELTFKEFAAGKPCEVMVRKQPFAPQKFFVKFAELKEKIKKPGRPSEQSKNLLDKKITPRKLSDLIVRNVRKYTKNLSI